VRAILEAALEQLGTFGYSALSIDDVAHVAQVHKTTIYRRWPTKADLVIAAVVASRDDAPRFVPCGRLRDDLVSLLRCKARSVASPRKRAIAHALNTLQPSVSAALAQELRLRRYTMPRDIARGELPRNTDAALVTELLLAPIFYRALVLREPVPDTLIEHTVTTVLAGARAQKPRKLH
jgi:AcrR family transcriptional regulator